MLSKSVRVMTYSFAISVSAIAIGVAFLFATPADAASCTLTSTAPVTNWTDTTKWNCGGPATYPGQNAGDTATISLGGGYTLQVDVAVPNPVTIAMSCTGCALAVPTGNSIDFNGGSFGSSAVLNLAGGTLTHSGAVQFLNTTQFNWSSGTLTGAGSTTFPSAADALMQMQGPGTMTLNGHTINNGPRTSGSPAVTYTGGSLVLSNNAQIVTSGTCCASSGAQFQIGDLTVSDGGGGGGKLIFGPSGGRLARQSGAAGSSTFNVPVDINSGADVQFNGLTVGSIVFSAGGTHAGTFVANNVASEIFFNGGTHTLSAGAALSGLGTFRLSAGTLFVDTGATVTPTNFSLQGGLLDGPGTINISSLTWSSGGMAGAGVTTANGPTTMNPTLTTSLNGRTFNNNGVFTYTITGPVFQIINSAVFNNNGTFDATTDGQISSGGTQSTFNNFGTFDKSGGTGFFDITSGLNFENEAAGILRVSAPGTSAIRLFGTANTNLGTLQPLNASSEIVLSAGTLSLNGGAVGGLGIIKVAAGTMGVLANFTIPRLVFFGGTINGPSPIELTVNNLNWTGGTMGGSGKTTVNAGQIAFTTTTELNTRNFEVAGSLSMSGSTGSFSITNAANFGITLGSVVSVLSDFTILGGGAAGTISNNGTFQKTAGAGTFALDTATSFINAASGTLAATSGRISLSGPANSSTGNLTASAPSSIDLPAGLLTLNGGTVTGTIRVMGGTLTTAAPMTIPDLVFSSGTINGSTPNHLTVNALSWTGGTMSGTAKTILDGNGSIVTATGANLSGRTLDINALRTLQFSVPAGSFSMTSAATMNVFGTFDAISSGNILDGGPSSQINVMPGGTFRKSGGTMLELSAGVNLSNQGGAVDVAASSIRLRGTSNTNSGSIAIASATQFIVGSGAGLSLDPGTSVTGLGTFTVDNGTVTHTTSVTIPNLSFISGTITGASPLAINTTTLSWTGGTMTGGGTTNVNGASSIAPTSALALSNRTFNNNATLTVNLSSGSFSMTNTTVFNNNAAGTVDVQSAGSILGGGTQSTINNQGIFRKSAGAALSTATGVNFSNQATGTIDVLAGSIEIGGLNNTSTGAINIAGGATLDAKANVFNIAGGPDVTGSGQFRANGASVQISTAIHIPNVVISAATVNDTGGLSMDTLSWTGGSLTGTAITTVMSSATLSPAAAMFLNAHQLVLNGPAVFNPGVNNLTIQNGSTLVNTVSFTVTGGTAFFSAGPTSTFDNQGIFLKTGAGSLTVNAGITVLNSGTVETQSGIMGFVGTFTNSGLLYLNGGNFLFSSGLTIGTGTLSGVGTVNGNVTNDLGLVSPGLSPGIININGNYTQQASGTLDIQLAGTTPGTQHDQLAVSGTATLGGTMNVAVVGPYFPAGGDSFQVLLGSPVSGTFATINGLNLGAGTTLNPVYSASDLTLVTGFSQTDLSLGKTAPASVNEGQNFTYTLTVSNAGPSPSSGSTITDNLPAGVTVISMSPSCSGTTTITCTIGALAVGANTSVTITVSAPVGSYSNSASVVAADFDPNGANNTGGPVTTNVVPSADLSITKADAPDPVPAGGTLTYTLTVSNAGPSGAGPITVSDTLPVGVTLVSATGAGWSCSGTTVITCSGFGATPLMSGASTVITIVVTAPASGGSIANSAGVSSPVNDPNFLNNSAAQATTVTATADLAVVKSGPATVTAGQTVTYTIAVTNNGPSGATNVSLTDTTSAGLTFVSASGACTAFPCTIPSLGAAQTVTTSATFAVGAGATGSVTNSASVSAAGITDPVAGNNSSAVTSSVVQSADVSIGKTGPATASLGQNVIYIVTVMNNGPSNATGVVVNDPTPAGLTFVSNTGACTTAYPCNLGNLAAGSTLQITTTYNVPPTFPGASFTNTATVNATTPDPSNLNNSSSATTSVSTMADLRITKRAQGTVSPTGNVTFTIVVTNLGPSTATNVVVNDPTPSGATWVSNSGDCSTPFPCNFPSLNVGQSVTINATFSVSSGTAIRNTASVTATTLDPVPSNNSAAASAGSFCPSDPPAQVRPNEIEDAPLSGSITWSNVGADEYEVYFGPAGGGCNTLAGRTSSTSFAYSGLEPARRYESRIVAVTRNCQSVSSSCLVWQTTGACDIQPPILLAPPNGSTQIARATLRWSAVARATRYTVFVGINGATPVERATTSDTSLTIDVGNGPVVWFVIASADSCSARSADGSFNGCAVPEAPRAGVVGAPTSNQPFVLGWDAVPGAVRYEADEADNAEFIGATTRSTAQVFLEYKYEALTAAIVRYYRVRAIGTCTNEPGPNSRTVRVVVVPIPASNRPNPNVNIPAGNRDEVIQEIFIEGEPDGPYNFTASADQPWILVDPPAGVIQPQGMIFKLRINPRNVPGVNGTFTGTVIVNLVSPASANVIGHAVTSKSKPVSVNLVTPVKPGDKASPTAETLIIPSVGHLAGINSLWRSDIRILNTGASTTRYQLDFVTSGATDVKQTIIEVGGGETTALDDIVHNWYGIGEVGDSANGILEIRPLNSSGTGPNGVSASLATAASSRTYSTSGAGTLGQFIPAVPFVQFVGKAAPDAAAAVLSLQQVAQSDLYRTNLGVVEGAGSPVSVLASIFNSAGQKLLDVPIELKAGEQRQLNGFLAANNITLADGRIEVRVTGGDGKVTAYASVVDNRSVDPLLVSAVQVGSVVSNRYVLPGVADLSGGGASWRTDMRIFNGGSAPENATLTFYPQNNASAPLSATVSINPNEVKVLDGVLQSLFSARDVGGAIHVTTPGESKLTVTGRTYNQTSEGTFGQFVPAVTSAEGVGRGGRTLNILQLEDSVRLRSNVGIAEVTGNPATVEVTLFLPDTKVTPRVEIPLAANEFRQFAIIRDFGLQNVYNARVSIRVVSGTGAVTAYGSVIDQLTTDPTYVPAQ